MTTSSLSKFYSRLASQQAPDLILAEAKKTSTELEYFKSNTTGTRSHNLWDYYLLLYQCATCTVISVRVGNFIYFIFKPHIFLRKSRGLVGILKLVTLLHLTKCLRKGPITMRPLLYSQKNQCSKVKQGCTCICPPLKITYHTCYMFSLCLTS